MSEYDDTKSVACQMINYASVKRGSKNTYITHLDGFDGIVLIVRRTGGARQMIDLIHLEEDREGDIVPNEGEVGMVKPVLDIRLPPREEIVQHHHLVTLGHETIDQMRPDESRTAGDQDLLAQGVG